ncbi:hypothetical protein [Urbifossiella limnaea]|uniref:Uncharacterized protein n=1 Tax=Urbifossiella limnaea TaxID=2528023 RepID=A0A517Y1Z1_9BACT|nr:hypothetical protein [Urbifossiella limnaea]QDU23759.1 hypothetical protein ETAA1_57660 [Urbifossiella limnaea]
MRLRRRVGAVATALIGTAGCPGRGVVNRLAADEDADPPPCPACGGCHVLVVEEVVVWAAEPVGGLV